MISSKTDIIQRSPVLHAFICVYLILCTCIACVDLCAYDSQDIEHSITIRIPHVTPLELLPPPSQPTTFLNLATTNLFSISVILSFQECYINGIIAHVTFFDRFYSLSIISSRPIQVVECINNSSLFIIEMYSVVRLYHSLFNKVEMHFFIQCN